MGLVSGAASRADKLRLLPRTVQWQELDTYAKINPLSYKTNCYRVLCKIYINTVGAIHLALSISVLSVRNISVLLMNRVAWQSNGDLGFEQAQFVPRAAIRPQKPVPTAAAPWNRNPNPDCPVFQREPKYRSSALDTTIVGPPAET